MRSSTAFKVARFGGYKVWSKSKSRILRMSGGKTFQEILEHPVGESPDRPAIGAFAHADAGEGHLRIMGAEAGHVMVGRIPEIAERQPMEIGDFQRRQGKLGAMGHFEEERGHLHGISR